MSIPLASETVPDAYPECQPGADCRPKLGALSDESWVSFVEWVTGHFYVVPLLAIAAAGVVWYWFIYRV